MISFNYWKSTKLSPAPIYRMFLSQDFRFSMWRGFWSVELQHFLTVYLVFFLILRRAILRSDHKRSWINICEKEYFLLSMFSHPTPLVLFIWPWILQSQMWQIVSLWNDFISKLMAGGKANTSSSPFFPKLLP